MWGDPPSHIMIHDDGHDDDYDDGQYMEDSMAINFTLHLLKS